MRTNMRRIRRTRRWLFQLLEKKETAAAVLEQNRLLNLEIIKLRKPKSPLKNPSSLAKFLSGMKIDELNQLLGQAVAAEID